MGSVTRAFTHSRGVCLFVILITGSTYAQANSSTSSQAASSKPNTTQSDQPSVEKHSSDSKRPAEDSTPVSTQDQHRVAARVVAPELPYPLDAAGMALLSRPNKTGADSPNAIPLSSELPDDMDQDDSPSGQSNSASGQANSSGQNNAPSAAPKGRPSLEREFLKNVLRDQRAIWTAPFHVKKDQAYWLLPLAGATAALIATDRATGEDGGEFAAVSNHQKVSDTISSMGALYVPAALLGSMYVVGRVTGNNRERETALLSAEALADVTIVGQGLKLIFERQRPSTNNGEGEFFSKGSSFPSGHSLEAWSIATVIANEYHDHLWVEIAAYSAASLVSVSRYTGHHHFPSDILVGSLIGYGVGRYVYHAHHYQPGSAETGRRHILTKLKSHVDVAPIYDPSIRAYGGSLSYALW